MVKNYRKFLKASNAVDAAAPASVWGRVVATMGGATRNFDSKRTEADILSLCFGIKPEKKTSESPGAEEKRQPKQKNPANRPIPKGGISHENHRSSGKNEQKRAA